MATPALKRAEKATDDASRLSELLAAWRAIHHPRVADLIDRVSARLVESAGPITAKSAVARSEAIIKAVQSNDPVELGRALASTWPGSWQAAIPVVEAVSRAPDDPRVAKKFAAIVDEAKHQSNGSTDFWAVVFARLSTHTDVRQLPLLEAQLTRSKSRFYNWHSKPREELVVTSHRQTKVPELTTDDEAIIVRLEAPWAAQASTEKSTARSGDELLAAVYANPTDLGVRTVYGDWLVGQGDPRGEFIALQLAPRTEKSERKIARLRDAHWKRWLGPIADWFREPPAFEAGFPVSGLVESASLDHRRSAIEPVLSRPEWSTFRVLAMQWWPVKPDELVMLPRFKALESLRRLDAHHLEPLAKVKPGLKSVALDWGGDPKLRLARGTWDQFPRLEYVFSRRSYLDLVLSGFGARTLSTLAIDPGGPDGGQTLDEWWPQLDRAPIETVLLGERVSGIRVTREAPGKPFTRVHFPNSSSADLMHQLPPGVTHITSGEAPEELALGWRLDALNAAMARYAKLEVKELPAVAQPFQAELRIPGLDCLAEQTLPRLWKLITQDLGAKFSLFSVGTKRSQPLPDDGLGALMALARKKTIDRLNLEQPLSRRYVLFGRNAFFARLAVHDALAFFTALRALMAFVPTGSKLEVGDLTATSALELEQKKDEILTDLRTPKRALNG